MQFQDLAINGACVVDLDRREDSRGFFARSFCQREFADHGLVPAIAQCNVSWNRLQGTLRGIHYQRHPSAEAKLVRCVRGAVYDVVLDLRPHSETYRRWVSVELNEENRTAVYVPPGCGHGFQSLCDDTEILYQMSAVYNPDLESGVRWNDPAFAIRWPIAAPIISDRDRNYPDFIS